MSPNNTLKELRKSKSLSQAEVAYKLGCSIEFFKNIESDGYPIPGDLFLKILKLYDVSIQTLTEKVKKQNNS